MRVSARTHTHRVSRLPTVVQLKSYGLGGEGKGIPDNKELNEQRQ